MSKTLDQLCLRIQEIQAENRATRVGPDPVYTRAPKDDPVPTPPRAHTLDSRGKRKIIAVSKDRYRASATERRMYGGAAVTYFYVHYADESNDPAKWRVIKGYGKTPGERKTWAMKVFTENQGT